MTNHSIRNNHRSRYTWANTDIYCKSEFAYAMRNADDTFLFRYNKRKMHWTKNETRERTSYTHTRSIQSQHIKLGKRHALRDDARENETEIQNDFYHQPQSSTIVPFENVVHSVPPTTHRRTKTTAASVRKVRANEQQNRLRKITITIIMDK